MGVAKKRSKRGDGRSLSGAMGLGVVVQNVALKCLWKKLLFSIMDDDIESPMCVSNSQLCT